MSPDQEVPPLKSHATAEELSRAVDEMAAKVRHQLNRAVECIGAGDVAAAEAVIAGDLEIDRMEEDIERACLQLLGRDRHAGADERGVRRIAAIFKVVTDLERMGDHAAAVARTARRMRGERPLAPFVDIQRLAALADDMIVGAMAAFAAEDGEAARVLAGQDDGVDGLYDQVFRELVAYMLDDRTSVRQATHLLFVASGLERIADHATNISEWALYIESGKRVELND